MAEYAPGLAGNVGYVANYFGNRPIDLQAPFCSPCGNRFIRLAKTSQILHLAWVSTILLTIASIYVFGGIFGGAGFVFGLTTGLTSIAALRISWSRYVRRSTPQFETLTKNEAVLRLSGTAAFASRTVRTKLEQF